MHWRTVPPLERHLGDRPYLDQQTHPDVDTVKSIQRNARSPANQGSRSFTGHQHQEDSLRRLFSMAVLLAGSAARSQTASPIQAPTSTPLPSTASDQVTVTATRSSSPLGETAKTVFRLSPQALHDYPAVTLDESLRQHAGFELYRRAPSRIANPTSEGISLRGLGSTAASRTLVLEDGAPLNDPFGGYIHWSEQPQSTIEAVTLVTGGGSDLYGSSALGGVIDVLPRVPAASSPASTLDLSGMGGSETTSDLLSTASRVLQPFALLAAGESIHTAGYIVTAPSLAGAVDIPANLRSQSYRTELGRRTFPDQRFFLTGNLLDETRNNGTPLQTNATRLWRYLGGFDTPQQTRITARARLFGSDEGYRQSFSAISSSRNSESLTRLQRVHTQELGATGDATLQLGPFAAVAGADLRDLRASDNETPIANGLPNGLQDVSARQRFLGGFGELLGAYGGWSGAASLRADRASNLSIVQTTATSTALTRTTPPDRTEIVLSPRLGIVRALGQHVTAHASGFRAFRTPTFNELYRTGQVGQEITLPSASLVSERGTGWELGASLEPTRRVPFALQATYFWTIVNRPVSAVEIAQTATTLTEQRENLGQIRSRGVELALVWRPGKALSANLGYQYADATVTKFSVQPSLVGLSIPQVPRHSFTAQLRADSRHWGQATLAARASGQAFDDTANQFPLAAFFQLDASWRRALTRRLTVDALAQNLIDRRQQVARTPILTLGTPIFVEAGLQLHLGKQAP